MHTKRNSLVLIEKSSHENCNSITTISYSIVVLHNVHVDYKSSSRDSGGHTITHLHIFVRISFWDRFNFCSTKQQSINGDNCIKLWTIIHMIKGEEGLGTTTLSILNVCLRHKTCISRTRIQCPLTLVE